MMDEENWTTMARCGWDSHMGQVQIPWNRYWLDQVMGSRSDEKLRIEVGWGDSLYLFNVWMEMKIKWERGESILRWKLSLFVLCTYKCIAIIPHSSSVFDLLALLILLLLMTILPHLTHSAASYDYRIKRLYNNLRRGVCNELLYLSVIISLVSVPMPWLDYIKTDYNLWSRGWL